MLPVFRCYPDPVDSGALIESATTCRCCGQSRGYIYAGWVFGKDDYQESLCPWCIADGSAHEKLGVQFIDLGAVGGLGKWERVPDAVACEIAYRTPVFPSMQEPEWWTHCGDAAAFLGSGDVDRVAHYGLTLREMLAREFPDLTEEEWPEVKLFQCLKCKVFGGYWDLD